TLRQLVGVNVENLPARVVAEDQEVRQLGNRRVPIDLDARDGHAAEEWIVVVVLSDRPGETGFAAPFRRIDTAIRIGEAALPSVPSQVGARGDRADLLDGVLPDVGDEHPTGL